MVLAGFGDLKIGKRGFTSIDATVWTSRSATLDDTESSCFPAHIISVCQSYQPYREGPIINTAQMDIILLRENMPIHFPTPPTGWDPS